MTVHDMETATAYSLTDHDIERAKLLVDREVGNRHQEAFTTATYDAIRMYARGIGDDNPLYCDEHYGERTRWGTQVAPGVIARNINTPLRADPLPPEIKEKP
jgi:acyl dehydratase